MSEMLQNWLDKEPTPVIWRYMISAVEDSLQMKPLIFKMSKLLA